MSRTTTGPLIYGLVLAQRCEQIGNAFVWRRRSARHYTLLYLARTPWLP